MNKVILTNHAYDRLKERAGISKKSADRICARAYESGISCEDVTGSLKRYMTGDKLSYGREGFVAKIYGEFVYCFLEQPNGALVLTAFWVPKSLKHQSYASQKRKAA